VDNQTPSDDMTSPRPGEAPHLYAIRRIQEYFTPPRRRCRCGAALPGRATIALCEACAYALMRAKEEATEREEA